MTDPSQQKCGFVSIIGAPNAGKSTLLNTLIGEKVSIVSPKVQTTRSIVRGIYCEADTQIIFLDTPGIFKPKKRLERAMVKAAWDSRGETDLVMLVVDASKKGIDQETRDIISNLDQNKKSILILNKIDKIARDKLLERSLQLNELHPFEATFMVSALKQNGTKDIIPYIKDRIPTTPWMFPEDQVSDMPNRLLASEITREKLFLALHDELPYGLTVYTESWEVFENNSIKIDQTIFIERENHKKIILGKGGQKIKSIGEKARLELEDLLGERIHLKLFVKVKENWAEDPEFYQGAGLDHTA